MRAILRFLVERVDVRIYAMLYIAALVDVYEEVVFPYFSYSGFENISVSKFTWLFNIVLCLTPLRWMKIRLDVPSTLLMWCIYLITYVPVQIFSDIMHVYKYGDPFVFKLLLWAVFHASLYILARPMKAAVPWRPSAKVYWMGVWGLALVCYAIIFMGLGFNLRFISLLDVYDVRGELKDKLAELGALPAYAIVWVAHVINPLLLMTGLDQKKVLYVVAALVGQLIVFSLSGFKSSLAMIPSILILRWLMSKNLTENFGRVFTLTAAASIVIARLIEEFFLDFPIISTVATLRIVFTPAQLTNLYFDFFSGHDLYLLSHGIFKHFMMPRYSVTPPYLIGAHYFGSNEMSANANYFADGFANFGMIGVVLAAFGLSIILRIADMSSVAATRTVAMGMMLMPAFALTNCALLTTILTHGMGLAILLTIFAPEQQRGTATRDH